MQLAHRTQELPAEVFASLNTSRRQLEAQGKPTIDLSVGTPDFKPAPHVIKALTDAAQDPNNWVYALHDTPELTAAVCAYYERRFGVLDIQPAQVASCRGTQEGLGWCCAALANPGDTVLIPDPCYPIFQNAATLIGAHAYLYPLAAEKNFLPDLTQIPAAVADAARYMIVSLPANPVGSVGTPELYEKLIAFARTHNIVLIHDNAYSDIVDGPEPATSIFAYPGASEVAVEFLSLSKSFNVTGARLSFMVGKPELVDAFRRLRSQVDFGMFLPEQAAAIACLTGPLDQVQAQRQRYSERRRALYDALEASGWERPSGTGTMFVWARIPDASFQAAGQSSVQFALDLMQHTGVIVTPGAAFGPTGEHYVRLALVREPQELAHAAQLMGSFRA